MCSAELNKERALAILKNFVFPLKSLFVLADKKSFCSFLISLHERNGIYPSGISINESIFEIKNIGPDQQSDTIKVIDRYLYNIEYIRLSVDITLRNNHKTEVIEILFKEDRYIVVKLAKSFKYEEQPTNMDIDTLVSDFKKIISIES